MSPKDQAYFFTFQIRNIILSASPLEAELPDPFNPNLKMEQVPGITTEPKVHYNCSAFISPDLRKSLDDYLTNRAPLTFLTGLVSDLALAYPGMALTGSK